MPEHEGGFTPENQNDKVDITEAYLNSSRSELSEYLSGLPEGVRIEMTIDIADVDFDSIRTILTRYETARVVIRATDQDRELYKNRLPWKGVEWDVEQ